MGSDVPVDEMIEGVLRDLTFRSPFGVRWWTSGSVLPVEVAIRPVEHPVANLVVAGDDPVAAVAAFASEAQRFLTAVFGDRPATPSHADDPPPPAGSVPACPVHDHALVVGVGADGPVWSCPTTGWSCPFGGYEASWWPYPLHARSADVLSGIFVRLQARDVHVAGRSHLERGDDAWVYHLSPHLEDASPAALDTLRAAVAEAVAPVDVEIDSVTVLRTMRTATEAGERLGRSGMHHLARLEGVLARPAASEDCDVVVLCAGARVLVRLTAKHRIAGGSPFLLDETGAPFADVGDVVVLGGGHVGGVFVSGSIERVGPPPPAAAAPEA